MFSEEHIIKGEKHRGNYFIERTKQSRHGNRIAGRRLLAEKILAEFETFRAEGDRIPACCMYRGHHGYQVAVALLQLSEKDKCKTQRISVQPLKGF